MRPIITVTAVVLLHLCVIAVLVGVNGCRSTSGFEREPDLAAYSAGSRSTFPAPSIATPKPTTINTIAPVGPGGVYVAGANDTLLSIATRENVTLTALCAANGLPKNATLRPGQRIKIPAPAPVKTTKAATTAKSTAAPKPAAAAPIPVFTPLKVVPLSGSPAPATSDADKPAKQ